MIPKANKKLIFPKQMQWDSQLLSVTCFHSSLSVSLLRESDDWGGLTPFSDTPRQKMDCLLLQLSSSSPVVSLILSEKSCSERFWKLSRVPRGLGKVREVRRWKSLFWDHVSSSMSESMDVPVEAWLLLFFGGLSAETYWGDRRWAAA